MHSQGRHTDIDFGTGGTLLGQLRIGAAVGLLVPRQVRRRGVMFATFCARIAGPLLGLGRRRCRHTAISAPRSAITNEEGVVCIADCDTRLGTG